MLKKIKQYFLRFSKFIAKIQTAIILFLVYYLVIMPLGLARKIIKEKHQNRVSYWEKIPLKKLTLKDYYKQY
jgi:hypothetical protein